MIMGNGIRLPYLFKFFLVTAGKNLKYFSLKNILK